MKIPLIFIVFVVFILISQSQGIQDNAGSEFVIGFMSTASSQSSSRLYLSNPHSTTVTFRVRHSQQPNSVNRYTLNCGEARVFTFSGFGANGGTSIEPKGLLITSDKEITLNCANVAYGSYDVFLALPTDVLGTNYYAVTYYPCGDACQVLVVAVQNFTMVSITMGSSLGENTVEYNGTTYAAGETLNVVLNQYDMFQFHSLGDLSGTHIVSDKVTAVFSGNKDTSIGSGYLKTNLVEQLTPVKTWGKTFVLAPTPQAQHSSFIWFLASENSTEVRIRGDCLRTFTITNAGDVARVEVPLRSVCHAVADKPIQVVKFTQGYIFYVPVDNPSMFLIPPNEQFSSNYTFGNSKDSREVYLTLILNFGDLEGLRLDGNKLSLVSAKMKNLTDIALMIVQVSVSSNVAHTVRHISPNVTFGGTLYGFFDGVSTYSYPVGMRMVAINNPCNTTVPEVGDGIDNDCDGMVDEELCDVDKYPADLDGDGRYNEDCVAISTVNGGWSPWSSYSACSLTCVDDASKINGTRLRWRSCTNPIRACDGNWCSGDSTQTLPCYTDIPCPINGGWTNWTSYSACSVTCSYNGNTTKGLRERSRSCTNPIPQYNGILCEGSAKESQLCWPTDSCPGYLDDVSTTGVLVNDVSTSAVLHEVVSTTTELKTPIPGYASAVESKTIHNLQTTPSLDTSATTWPSLNESSVGCSCNWFRCRPDLEELYSMVEELKAKLRITRNQTSLHKRSLNSANDPRPSAHAVGYISSAILASIGLFLIVVDRGNLLNMMKMVRRNLCSR